MKLFSTVIIRTIGFIIFLGLASLVVTKLCLMAKKMVQIEKLQAYELRNKTISEIENVSRLLRPMNSSTSNLAGILGSSVAGKNLSFAAIQTEVAPKLFLAISILPNLIYISYLGQNNLLYAYYKDKNRTSVAFANTSYSSTWYTQRVHSYTGKLYGQAMSMSSLIPTNSTWLQEFLNATIMYTTFLSKSYLLSDLVAVDGGGMISLGFSSRVVVEQFKGVDFHGGDFFLATIYGQVLVKSKIQGVEILVNNQSVQVFFVKDNGEFEDKVVSYSFLKGKNDDDNGDNFGQFDVNIRGLKHKFYCSTLIIAGIKTVYTLAYPSKGIEEIQVHKNSKIEFTLLGVMLVIVVASLCIFIALIVRSARREMYLCTALIKQRESTHQAERKSMNKSLAFASASHDVRNSLTVITGLIKLCHESVDPNSELAANLVQMNADTMDILGVLNSVMDTSKIEAGKMQLEEVEFNLAQLLEDVVEMYYPTGITKGVDVILDLCDESILKLYHVKGDRGKLKQILCNLLSNAIKFTSEGHVILRAFVQKTSEQNAIIASNQKSVARCFLRMCGKNYKSLTEYDELHAFQKSPNCMEFVFEVEDTGKGIPKEKQKSVFEYFVQVKETALEQGCGLGLGIVQSLVRLMGGEIKIVDKEQGERGTCFQFNIFLSTCDAISTTEVEEEENYMHNEGPTSTNFHQYFQLITRCPTSRIDGSHVILLIPSEERRRISEKLIKNLGIKVCIANKNEDLVRILEKIKTIQYSSSGRTGASSNNDQLHKSQSKGSNSINEGSLSCDPRKSSSKFLSSFILFVIDASFSPFLELYSIVENFMKELPNSPQCKVVWLDNMVTRHTSSVESTHQWEQFLMKPFHGSHLYRVLRLLPEFGGTKMTHISFSPTWDKKHDLKELVIHESSEEQSCDEKKPLKGKKVLVVEDGVALRKLAFTFLSKLGAIVDVCEDGKEAFDRVWKALSDQREEGHSMGLPYDYILMDCQMPVMDGYEATRLIRMNEKEYGIRIPIIALTAQAESEEFASKIKDAGMDFYLTKPLQVEKLLAAITKVERNNKFGLTQKGKKIIG